MYDFITWESTILSNLKGPQSLAATNQQATSLQKLWWDAREDKSEPRGGGGRTWVGAMALRFYKLHSNFIFQNFRRCGDLPWVSPYGHKFLLNQFRENNI